MHGLYDIRVVRSTDGSEVLNYTASTHPAEGDWIQPAKGQSLLVCKVKHVLKEDRNGGGPVYTAFSHVLVSVAL